MAETILKIDKLSCGYGNKLIVKEFSASVKPGEILCMLGPNGVGKTTLFKTILGFLPAKGGRVLVGDKEYTGLSRKEKASLISYVPQVHTPPFPFKVNEVVVMGRSARLSAFAAPGRKDMDAAEEALESLGVGYLKDRVYTEISGGERQMVLIARALVQETQFLMMDEPTSNLDFGNQVRALDTIKKLANERNLGIVMTTHFPDHAFYCNSRVALMKRDFEYVEGLAKDIIVPKHMDAAYGIRTRVLTEQNENGTIHACVPIGL